MKNNDCSRVTTSGSREVVVHVQYRCRVGTEGLLRRSEAPGLVLLHEILLHEEALSESSRSELEKETRSRLRSNATELGWQEKGVRARERFLGAFPDRLDNVGVFSRQPGVRVQRSVIPLHDEISSNLEGERLQPMDTFLADSRLNVISSPIEQAAIASPLNM